MSNFWQRTFTGIAFVATIVLCVLLHEFSFFALFLIIATLASYEFYDIVGKTQGVSLNKFAAVTASALLFSACFFSIKLSPASHYFFYIYVLFNIGLIINELFRKKENPINNWAYLLLGQVFIALPFALLNYLVFPFGNFSPIFLLALFILIWINDTGAYLFGISFGKHRLFERISPKKSWEGFFGGVALALTFAYFIPDLLKMTDSIYLPYEVNRLKWVGFALVVTVSGTFGDFIESLLKRTVNIKDSGKILPGHGGLLDRFDSLLLAAPMAYIYLQIVL